MALCSFTGHLKRGFSRVIGFALAGRQLVHIACALACQSGFFLALGNLRGPGRKLLRDFIGNTLDFKCAPCTLNFKAHSLQLGSEFGFVITINRPGVPGVKIDALAVFADVCNNAVCMQMRLAAAVAAVLESRRDNFMVRNLNDSGVAFPLLKSTDILGVFHGVFNAALLCFADCPL